MEEIYVIIVLTNEDQVEEVKLRYDDAKIPKVVFIPVSESEWKGRAGNGLGTLFALSNAKKKMGEMGIDLFEALRRGDSALMIHTAGEGTRNLIARTKTNKSLIELPGLIGEKKMTILDGVMKQSLEMTIPGRILVSFGDQLIFADMSNMIEAASRRDVMLFGLEVPELTEEICKKYGIQLVDGEEIIGFDDTRDYGRIKAKLDDIGGDIRINMGTFSMKYEVAEMLLRAFEDNLEEKNGIFNSDEVWQAWVSKDKYQFMDEIGDKKHAEWIWDRVDPVKREIIKERGGLISSFRLKDALWLDFGTNENYYRSVMKLTEDTVEGEKLREFLGVEKRDGSISHGSEVYGDIEDSILFDSDVKDAKLKDACLMNSRIEKLNGERCVIYNVIEDGSLEVEDSFIVDVFHPKHGRIRLKMGIWEEKERKEEWWKCRIYDNPLSLEEVSEMMRDVSWREMERTREKMIEIVDYIIKRGNADGIRDELFLDLNTEISLMRMAKRGDHLGGLVFDKDVLRTLTVQPMRFEEIAIKNPWGMEYRKISRNNALKGLDITLDELLYSFPEILGEDFTQIKFLDAKENLSVQVHPDKTEAWYVMKAEEGAKIYLGFKKGMTRERFKELIHSGRFGLESLNAIDVREDDVYYIPAGTIHALGVNIEAYEIQQDSDLTFRIYDYGRGRDLHIDDAMKVLNFEEGSFKREPMLIRRENGVEVHELINECFSLHRFQLTKRGKMDVDVRSFQTLTCISGRIKIRDKSGTIKVSTGESLLIPATIDSYTISADGIETEVLSVGR